VQQEEMDKHGEEMIHLFSSRKDQWRELLTNVELRAPDKTIERRLLDANRDSRCCHRMGQPPQVDQASEMSGIMPSRGEPSSRRWS
jgi:hypothetical protein